VNHYFAPHCGINIIENYIHFFRSELRSHLCHMVMLDDVNVPHCDILFFIFFAEYIWNKADRCLSEKDIRL
jgi:hypothetical protein